MEKPKGRREHENVGKPVGESSDFVLPEGFVPPDEVPSDVDASRTAHVDVDDESGEVLSGAAWEYKPLQGPKSPVKRIWEALKKARRRITEAFSGSSQQ